jgi:hypothetical protein
MNTNKNLTLATLQVIFVAAISRLTANGARFYRWINRPNFQGDGQWHDGEWEGAPQITPEAASKNLEEKTNGAYGERFLASLGLIAALIANGYKCRFVQFRKEVGIPFDATGWTCIVVETMPVFHIAPWDLDTTGLAEVVELLDDNKAVDVSWKDTDKVGEYTALLQGTLTSGLDLVAIAQAASEKNGE